MMDCGRPVITRAIKRNAGLWQPHTNYTGATWVTIQKGRHLSRHDSIHFWHLANGGKTTSSLTVGVCINVTIIQVQAAVAAMAALDETIIARTDELPCTRLVGLQCRIERPTQRQSSHQANHAAPATSDGCNPQRALGQMLMASCSPAQVERQHGSLCVEPVLDEDGLCGVVVRRAGRGHALRWQHNEWARQAIGAVCGRVVVPEVRPCQMI